MLNPSEITSRWLTAIKVFLILLLSKTRSRVEAS
ncbi:hypothetical protein V6Z11_A05G161100 [Gossypium hirsutum]